MPEAETSLGNAMSSGEDTSNLDIEDFGMKVSIA
jgi:hypothetical protein